jgi:DNA-binding response OmpR family regulator
MSILEEYLSNNINAIIIMHYYKIGVLRNKMKKLLIIEDDIVLQEGLEFALKSEYSVKTTDLARKGIEYIKECEYDVVILDCNLPDGNGYDICETVRQFTSVPILMLTARDSEMDEVKALEIGVDDYMSKPFSLSVLKARLRKVMKNPEEITRIISSGFVIDKNMCKIWKKEKEITCTSIEFRLILYLIENKNIVISKEQILHYIWDQEGKFVDDNVVSVNIRRLRAKIEENPSEPKYIQTVYGMGYIWKEE